MKEKISRKIGEAKDKVIQHTWVERAARLGFVVRGVIYLLTGFVGLQFALGLRKDADGYLEVIVTVGQQPLGKFLLVAIFLGLAGYSFWGFVRAVFNVMGEGKNIFGWVTRIGYGISAISYGSLALAVFSLLRGLPALENGDPKKLSHQVLSFPFGREILMVVGICWIIGAAVQIVLAAKGRFKEDLKMGEMGKKSRIFEVWTGKIGLVSRSVVFALVGFFIVAAAAVYDPSKVYSVAQVLEFLKNMNGAGPVVLSAVSLGLIAFGLFSIVSAKFAKLSDD